MLLNLVIALSTAVFNRPPLEEVPYAYLPLGAVRAEGWLHEQLSRQAQGLTGQLDEVYPSVMGADNAWQGGDGDAWERGPYWVDGLLPLAWILDDEALKEKALRWVEAILRSQREDGNIGPAEDHPYVYGLQRGKSQDWWPRMVALKILQQYYDATEDERVPDCLGKYFRFQLKTLPEKKIDYLSDWGKWRAADNIGVALWLYNLTGDDALLQLARLLQEQMAPWTRLFRDGSVFSEQNSLHCVNLAQGFKSPGVVWQFTHDPADRDAPQEAVRTIRHTVGLPTGLWAGDELLHFGHPSRGSELCTAVEMMYSLEELLRITGNPLWADYLERVAFNALPAQVNDDFTAKQYFQQTNQTSCTRSWKPFSTPHDGTDQLFGTLNGYPCCLSNMHQGWPKFTRSLWMQTEDGGLAALVYAPSSVRTRVEGDVAVQIEESTGYPFREEVEFRIHFPSKKVCKAVFPLRLRVPSWCDAPQLLLNGKSIEAERDGQILYLNRTWKRGDCLTLRLPMSIRHEEGYDRAWTIVRGPLVYALKMEEKWNWLRFEGTDRYYGEGAWEVRSDTPWNYCLMREEWDEADCTVRYAPLPDFPWNAASAPVSLLIPARVLNSWEDSASVAFFTEDGMDIGAETTLELIPYGCTTLRIASFPTRVIPWDLELRREMFTPQEK